MKQFTANDWAIIYDSLKYTKLKFEEYDRYPSEEYKKQKIEEVVQVMAKVYALRKSAK